MKKITTLLFVFYSLLLQGQNDIKKTLNHWTGNGNPKGTSSFPANSVKQYDTYVNYVTDSIFRYMGNGIWNSCMDCYGPAAAAVIPSFQIGTVTTLTPGSQATAALRPVGNIYFLDLGIPAGKDGINGTGGSGKGMQILNSFYDLTQTTDTSPAIVLWNDSISKYGAGLYVYNRKANFPSAIGDIWNKGTGQGCWYRVEGTRAGQLYNSAWAGKQLLSMGDKAKPINQYAGSMSQAIANALYGSGKVDITKDTYDQAALSYSTSLQGRVGYAYLAGPSGDIYWTNRTVSPASNYEVLPGHGVNNVPNDRSTECSKMGFYFNASVIRSINNNPYALFAHRFTDFSQTANNASARSYMIKDLQTYGNSISSAIIRDTAIDMRATNGSVIEDCNFYNMNMGFYGSFAMHTRYNRNDNGGIFGIAVKFSDKGLSGGSAFDTPCNGSGVTESHFSGETYGNGQWGIWSEETDAFLGWHNSFEGHQMQGNIYFEALGSWCKGFNIDGIRNEHDLREGILKLKMKEGWPDVGHIWDQSNSVYVDAEFTSSGIVHVRHTDYLSATGLKMRMRNGAFFDFDHNFGINNISSQPNSKIIWDGAFGGITAPSSSRFSVAGFQYQNWVPTSTAARQAEGVELTPEQSVRDRKTWIGKILYDISPFKTKVK